MKHVIVTKKIAGGIGAGLDDTYANRTPDDLDNLTEGTISLGRLSNGKYVKYTSDTAIFDSTFSSGEKVQFALQTPNGIVNSPMIEVDTFKYYKAAFNATTAKVIDLGYSSTTTGETWTLPTVSDNVGGYASVTVVDMSVPHYKANERFRVASYRIKANDTAATVSAGLLTELKKFNSKYYASVTANNSGTDYGYTFTGITGKNFTIVPGDLLEDSAVTVTTDFEVGIGEGADIVELEKEGAIRKGYNPSEGAHSEMFTAEMFADKDTDYDVYTMTWQMANTQKIAAGTDPLIQELIVAIPKDGSSTSEANKVSSQMEDLLDALSDQTDKWANNA